MAGDHAGYALKEKVVAYLKEHGFEVIDAGPGNGEQSVDYPDFAHRAAEWVANGQAQLGVVMCGSGNGVNIVANKHQGVRSALAWDPRIAALARQHNNANMLALPARFLTEEEALRIVDAYLDSRFEGGRHQTRVEKIEQAKGAA